MLDHAYWPISKFKFFQEARQQLSLNFFCQFDNVHSNHESRSTFVVWAKYDMHSEFQTTHGNREAS